MAEQRLFHATIKNPNTNKTEYEAFYKAHKVGDVRQDAGNRHVSRGNREAFTVEHKNLTNRPTEFYDKLSEAEQRSSVRHEKVPGLGHRWEVQKDEDASPFGIAPVDGGGVPPSLLEDNEDQGDILSHEIVRPANFSRGGMGYGSDLRAKPEFYDVGAMLMSEDPIEEMTRQDHAYAIGGFDVPLGSEKTPKGENGKKVDTGGLKVPTAEEQAEELERLRQDPNTYERQEDKVETAASRSHSTVYFI